MITEAYTTIEKTMRYYGDATSPGAHLPFNFGLISYLNDQSDAADFESAVLGWLDNMPEGKWANWVVRTHERKHPRTENTRVWAARTFSRSETTISHAWPRGSAAKWWTP